MLTVVIPTLDAATTLPATLAALASVPVPPAVVIADGGSTDATRAIAEARGAAVVLAPRGRGGQLAAGARAAARASGRSWLLFLHADTVLGPEWPAAVAHHIRTHPDRAGYFRFALDDPSPAARRIERLVRWRCAAFALPYGDQGLLIARDLYDRVGGFAPLPLMEDVDLVRRLGRGRLVPMAATATTSAVRYRRGGWWRRPLRNLSILSLWFCGASPAFLARLYR
ncbi:MAG: TIGR04283 family arsenosugar biosynthesis glycosyltransferase [Alphaproteobacteria bacterium]|nr:TIGR04283 family arsenosugar biosynthesis glycosyltransferase [Alphaproteobacteria bacterium]